MVHLRLIVAPPLVASVVDELRASEGVSHVVHVADVSSTPTGELILCDVAREAANELIEWLRDQGVHRSGLIAVSELQSIVSDAAERADAQAPGEGVDAVIWEELEARTREESRLSWSFLVFIGIAAVIAGIGILLDAPILIIGAMVLSPEYGTLGALCVGAVRRRWVTVSCAATTLATGLAVAAAATLVATAAFRASGVAPERYGLTDRELTAFISRPDAMAAIVAVLAGVAGMVSLTSGRGDALIGVVVSATTIPAVANIGVATAYGQWGDVGGAAAQLTINLAGLVLAGVATLAVVAHRYRPTR